MKKLVCRMHGTGNAGTVFCYCQLLFQVGIFAGSQVQAFYVIGFELVEVLLTKRFGLGSQQIIVFFLS